MYGGLLLFANYCLGHCLLVRYWLAILRMTVDRTTKKEITKAESIHLVVYCIQRFGLMPSRGTLWVENVCHSYLCSFVYS